MGVIFHLNGLKDFVNKNNIEIKKLTLQSAMQYRWRVINFH